MEMLKELSILKLGNHGESNKRIWIATRNILKTGLSVGSRMNVTYGEGEIIFEKDDNGSKLVSGRDENTPIIDLKNRLVADCLGAEVEKIEVRFFGNGRIVATIAKKECRRHARKQKNGNSFFELFAGGGILGHFFKKAGFKSIGGVEREENYLAVYDTNNPQEDKLTIHASIEDVDVSDYPQADYLLMGIPCTTYSAGNKQMVEELKKVKKGQEADSNVLAKRYEAEALVFHCLQAVVAINPKGVVVEEVEGFAETGASLLLRTVLSQMGYHLSETVSESSHTQRKRWCLVAHMDGVVPLDNLLPDTDKLIADFLDGDLEDREWTTLEENKRLYRASQSVGVRDHSPFDKKIRTVTTHSTRGTEPCLKHPTKPLYSEFTNSEVASIHGLDESYTLPPQKTLARQVLGQGVADMFYHLALRLKNFNPNVDCLTPDAGSNQLVLFG